MTSDENVDRRCTRIAHHAWVQNTWREAGTRAGLWMFGLKTDQCVRKRLLDMAAFGLVAGSVLVGVPARAGPIVDAESLRDDHVNRAIEAVVEELYERRHPQRCWEPPEPIRGESPQAGGYTAIVVLSLLYAGESYQSARLSPAIDYLRDLEPGGTYAYALRAAVWAKLPPQFRDHLERDTRWLLNGFSPAVGGWDYRGNPQTQRVDLSIAQYGALALWEASRRGVAVPDRYWRRIEQQYLDLQVDDGGWNYQGHGPSTGSMTTAGLMTMFIAQDLLYGDAYVDIRRRPKDAPHQRAMQRGLDWLAEHFDVEANPGQQRYYTYYMYNLERVGLAGGHKHFGGRDWFRLGAAALLNRFFNIDEAGEITVRQRTRSAGRGRTIRNRDLAFILMFLSRGRVPVAINKLRHSEAGWNNRPRDVANFTEWMRQTSVTDINWQVIDPARPVTEWLDAAMVYMAGDRPPQWIDANRQALRDHLERTEQRGSDRRSRPDVGHTRAIGEYLDRGGMIFAVDEGRGRFAESIELLGNALYPEASWRTLEDDHPAYELLWSVPAPRPVLRGLSNGVRELIIVAPRGDIAGVLQGRRIDRTSIYQTVGNIYLYASEQQALRPRLAAHAVESVSEPDVSTDSPLRLVRASHDGVWNPEPAALDVFATALAEKRDRHVEIDTHPLDAIDELDPPPTLVLASGVRGAELPERQQHAVRNFVDSGGVILFETVGGAGGFARQVERQALTWFDTLVISTFNSGIITGEGIDDAVDLRRVTYRPAAAEQYGTREVRAKLRGQRIDGQFRVLFSRQDITHGLLDQPCWGIVGYSPAVARDLLGNVLLYAETIQQSASSPSERDAHSRIE